MRIIFTFVFILLCSSLMASPSLEFFYQHGCDDCEKVEKFIFPQLEKDVRIIRLDTSEQDNFLKLIAYLDKFKSSSNETVYIVVNGKYLFAGYSDIEKRLLPEINVMTGSGTEPEKKNVVKKHSSTMTFLTVLSAGLVDGINPCVFSALVFLISLLAVSGVKGRTLLLVGTVYCIACFLTYLAVGLGLLSAIKALSSYYGIKKTIHYSMAFILIILAIFSFSDAVNYMRTGNASSVILKLPERLKLLMNGFSRRFLKTKAILPAAFVIGVVVTIIESACTGQVYVPTLVLISSEEGVFSKYFIWLLFYNLMFIIPLILVFIAAYCGLKLSNFLTISRRSVIYSKLAMSIFFTLLAVIFCLI